MFFFASYFELSNVVVTKDFLCKSARHDALNLRKSSPKEFQKRLETLSLSLCFAVYLYPIRFLTYQAGVIFGIGEDDGVFRQRCGERLHDAEVGAVAAVEEQRRVVADHLRQLALELDVRRLRARDIARAAGAGPVRVERVMHCRNDAGVVAHVHVVVRAPVDDPALVRRLRGARRTRALTATRARVLGRLLARQQATRERRRRRAAAIGRAVGDRGQPLVDRNLHAHKRMQADNANADDGHTHNASDAHIHTRARVRTVSSN